MHQPAFDLLYQPEQLPPVQTSSVGAGALARIEPALPSPLNEEQSRAFRTSFERRVSLVWGPPGTGKTTVVAATILGWLQRAVDTDRPVCIGVGSNTWEAIDLVLKEVADLIESQVSNTGIDLWTAVAMYRVRSDYTEAATNQPRVTDVGRGSPGAGDLVAELNAPDGRSLVVGSTWQQFSKLAANRSTDGSPTGRWFDLLILDEASQIKVAAATAYYLLLKESGHVVLAGDDKQLGPILSFSVEDTQAGLLDSVFSYMMTKNAVSNTQLVSNYRTNIEIAEWPKQRFYTDYRAIFPSQRLPVTVPDAKPDGWPDEQLIWSEKWATILDPDLPIAVVTYPAKPYTLANPFEAHAIAALAALLRLSLGTGNDIAQFWEHDLAVVTPHRAQVAAIRKLLLSARSIFSTAPPKVDTVERIQGRQRDMMLACYSVADKDFVVSEEEFIMDPRRFNVTLTRAKMKFVLFLSESLLEYLPSDLELAKNAAHLQLFVVEYCRLIGDAFTLPYFENNVAKEMPGCRLRGCTVLPEG